MSNKGEWIVVKNNQNKYYPSIATPYKIAIIADDSYAAFEKLNSELKETGEMAYKLSTYGVHFKNKNIDCLPKEIYSEKGLNKNMKTYCVSYEKNDVNQAIIVNANDEKEASNYVASYKNCDKVWGASELQQSLYESYKKRGMPEITVPETFNKNKEENEINTNEDKQEEEPDICDEY